MIAEIRDIKKLDISYNDNKNLQIDGNSIEFIHLEKEDSYNYDPFSQKRFIIQNNPLYIGVRLKNISRKRFIKLLMGKLMHKRLAEQFADFIFNRYGYYNELFIAFFKKLFKTLLTTKTNYAII